MSFEDRHPGLKKYPANHVFGFDKEGFYCESAIDATQLDKQRVKEAIAKVCRELTESQQKNPLWWRYELEKELGL